MKLIIGLGNPGEQYEYTRHNVGFLAVEYLRNKFTGTHWQDVQNFHSLIAEGNIEHNTLRFIKPMTYMNLSGDAVKSVVHFYKLDPHTDILIISDDLDMEFAKVRYRKKGSHGGHNGLRDIETKLGTSEYSRIKIGIGRNKHIEVSHWVLSKFTQTEREILNADVFPKVEEYMRKWLYV